MGSSKWWNLQVLFVVVLVCVTVFLVWNDRSTKTAPTHLVYKKRKEKRCQKKNEKRCRAIVEELFGKQFPTIRPSWLRNPKTKRRLEIDMFNPTVKTPLGKGLGFEYDGVQHHEYTPHYHPKGPQQFVEQCERDHAKDRICRERGVLLVRIPSSVPYEGLEKFIKEKLTDLMKRKF